jgi:hypothetical protein
MQTVKQTQPFTPKPSRSRWYVHTKRGKPEAEGKPLPTLFDYFMSLKPRGGNNSHYCQQEQQPTSETAKAVPLSRKTPR